VVLRNAPAIARRSEAGWLALLALLCLGLVSGYCQTSREYQLKAVFLYNFAQFTDWPTNAFASTNSPIVIGVLGADPFGSALEDTVRGEIVHGRRLVVEHYRRADEIRTCHILFISQSETRTLEQQLDILKGKPVLTVSDIEQSAFRGAMIRLVTEKNKIRLRVNLDAVKASNLVISSKLLRAAEIVPSVSP
jgi:hypothetical protein